MSDPEKKKPTRKKKKTEQTAATLVAEGFTVTLADGQAFRFNTGTLRQRMASDTIWAEMQECITATDVINLLLPVITAQLAKPAELMDLVTVDQLCEIFAAFRSNMDLDLSTKKN